MAGESNRAQAPADRTQAFLERARLEADRYGPDPWIFVRELLQNSRDAGATHVSFVVQEGGGREVVVCRDDGEGMTFEHARRYLFSLYASSKEGAKNQAGKFGVGFWSILRFEPITITIRSKPRNGPGWGLRLDGSLKGASEAAPLQRPGTEITLERSGGDGRLEHRVFDAVWQSARYLHSRDDSDRPLPVLINQRPANAEFALGAPSAAFRKGHVRGVVGLGPAPRVELFSRGLRVRSAACLEDLVAPTGRHTSRMRVQFPELPGGLAPQALLESDQLEVMLSRSDARDNRALTRLVRLAQRELERLVDQQLAQARPQPLWRRGWHLVSDRLRDSLVLRTAVGSVLGALLAFAATWWVLERPDTDAGEGPTNGGSPSEIAVAGGPEPSRIRPFRDLGARYRGPKVDVLSPGSAEPVELRYAPTEPSHHFAALTFPRLGRDGSPVFEPVAEGLGPYRTAACEDDCTDVQLPILTTGGAIRIPVPTGHRVVQGSVRLGDRPADVYASAEGHPTIYLEFPWQGTLRYRTVAAVDPEPRGRLYVPPSLPRELHQRARQLRNRPIEERVQVLLELVQRSVRYDRSPELAARHVELADAGIGFLERTLEIGAGDCDVQNGLLVALLHGADVPARLAVGYLGIRGEVLPWLHAWVEFRDRDGRWHVADASDRSAMPLPIATGPGRPSEITEPEPLEPTDDAGEPSTPSEAASSSVEPPARVPSSASSADVDDGGWAIPSLAWPLLPLVTLAFVVWPLVSGRTRRAVKLDQAADLSRLLQGVLQQPGAFGHVSSLFNRPLVPLLDGRAISLNRARELAAAGRLYRTDERPALARRAIAAGAAVLDARAGEGRTVADALGAIDLDRWHRSIERSVGDALCRGINATLRACREDWGVRLSSNVPGGLAILDIGALGVRVPELKGSRLVLLDDQSPTLASLQRTMSTRPNVAIFGALDELVERLGIPPARRARLMAHAARQMLLESFER